MSLGLVYRFNRMKIIWSFWVFFCVLGISLISLAQPNILTENIPVDAPEQIKELIAPFKTPDSCLEMDRLPKGHKFACIGRSHRLLSVEFH